EIAQPERRELGGATPPQSDAEEGGSNARAEDHEHEGWEGCEGELGERRIRSPEGGDQRQRRIGASLTGTEHPPMLARSSWPTTSSSGVSGCRGRAPTCSTSSPIREISLPYSRAGRIRCG